MWCWKRSHFELGVKNIQTSPWSSPTLDYMLCKMVVTKMTEPTCVLFSFSSSVNVSHAGEYVHEVVFGNLHFLWRTFYKDNGPGVPRGQICVKSKIKPVGKSVTYLSQWIAIIPYLYCRSNDIISTFFFSFLLLLLFSKLSIVEHESSNRSISLEH